MTVPFREQVVHLVVVLSVCAFAGTVTRVRGQPAMDEPVRQALEQNAKALSPITVTWERTRSSTLPEERVLALMGLPKTAREAMAPGKVRFMWQDGNFYAYYGRRVPQTATVSKPGKAPEFKMLLDRPLAIQEQEVSFDRTAYYSGSPNRQGSKKLGPAGLIITPVDRVLHDKQWAVAPLCRPDYLYCAGFEMPQTAPELMTQQPRSLVLACLTDAGNVTKVETAHVEGRAIAVVGLMKGGRQYQFSLDPEMNYAVYQWTMWDAGRKTRVKTLCRDFLRLEKPAHWLPRRIEIERYYERAGTEQLLYRETMVVSELHNERIKPEQFALVYREPGSTVTDGTVGAGITYTMPANPEDLDRVLQNLGYGPKAWSATMWILLVNVALLGALIAVILIRRHHRNAASGQ